MPIGLLPSGDTSGIVRRMGFGFFQSPDLKAIMSGAPAARSGVVATAGLLGQGFGGLLVALCLTIFRSKGPELALWMASGAAAFGCMVSVLRLMPQKARPLPDPLAPDLSEALRRTLFGRRSGPPPRR